MNITRRKLIQAIPILAASATAAPSLAHELVDPDERLKSAVGYVQAILRDMGCEEYVLMMREEKAGVLTLLDFVPGTGKLKRQIDLA